MIFKWLNKGKIDTQTAIVDNDVIEKCTVYYIPCDTIRPNAMRSRCDFNEDKLVELAISIKKHGIIEPITVKRTEEDDSYLYEIVIGERRLRAAKLAGLKSIPCIIINADLKTSAELSVIENIYSEPINYFEYAFALERMKNAYSDSFDEIISRLSINQNELYKKLSLLDLDYNERQILLNMNVSEETALAISQIEDRYRRHELIESICGEGLTDSAINERIDDIACAGFDFNSKSELPRDVLSVIKGICSKAKLLNRHKNRADVKISRNKGSVTAIVRIKL